MLKIKFIDLIACDELIMAFQLDRKEDGLLAQKVFRSLISDGFSESCTLGFQYEGTKFLEVNAFEYSCSRERLNYLIFDNRISEYSLEIRKLTEKL